MPNLGQSDYPTLLGAYASEVNEKNALRATYSGNGAPNIPTAAAGSYYFRGDTPSVSNQRIYVATGVNVWVGIV